MKLSFILIFYLLHVKTNLSVYYKNLVLLMLRLLKMQIQRNLTVLNGKVSVELWKE